MTRVGESVLKCFDAGPGFAARGEARGEKWTSAKPHPQHDVLFILVTGSHLLKCPTTFSLSLQSQQDKFDFDKFHQKIEDAKTKGGQVQGDSNQLSLRQT